MSYCVNCGVELDAFPHGAERSSAGFPDPGSDSTDCYLCFGGCMLWCAEYFSAYTTHLVPLCDRRCHHALDLDGASPAAPQKRYVPTPAFRRHYGGRCLYLPHRRRSGRLELVLALGPPHHFTLGGCVLVLGYYYGCKKAQHPDFDHLGRRIHWCICRRGRVSVRPFLSRILEPQLVSDRVDGVHHYHHSAHCRAAGAIFAGRGAAEVPYVKCFPCQLLFFNFT